MSKKILFLLLVLPLIVSGCFLTGKVQNQPNGNFNNNLPQENLQIYESQGPEYLTYTAKYPEGWEIKEISTGRFDDYKDRVIFSQGDKKITVVVANLGDKEEILDAYNITSQTQTEVDNMLADKYFGGSLTPDGYNHEFVLIENGDYLIQIVMNEQYAQELVDFLSNFTFFQYLKPKDINVTLRTYFAYDKYEKEECSIEMYKEAKVNRPLLDMDLIPLAIRLLIQMSDPADLEVNLSTAIPVGTALNAYGYDDNKVIVDFNSYINQGASDCVKQLRKQQIEQTLFYLNEVSDLAIDKVEIQADGQIVDF